MRGMRHLIAVVDDEETIRETVAFALRRDGYDVITFSDGAEAWDMLRDRLPSLAVLDITMPRMDGLELCRRLRARSDTLPIIFLTSRDEELDRVLGLELGADDYLCKPFSMRELAARIKVLFRRAAFLQEPAAERDEIAPLRVGPLALDLQRYLATWNGARVDLTVTEFLMLHALVRHPGHVKSRKQLTKEGYPNDTYISDRTIDTHIKRLRRKFEEADAAFAAIETVYGVGYRWLS
jgi:two-component system response regulator ChvI